MATADVLIETALRARPPVSITVVTTMGAPTGTTAKKDEVLHSNVVI